MEDKICMRFIKRKYTGAVSVSAVCTKIVQVFCFAVCLYVPTFKENGMLLLSEVCLFSQISTIEKTFFNKSFLNLIEDINLLNLNDLRYFTFKR